MAKYNGKTVLFSPNINLLPTEGFERTENKVTNFNVTDNTTYPTTHAVSEQLSQVVSALENKSNKVTRLLPQNTDTEYPSAKAVYDELYNSEGIPIYVQNVGNAVLSLDDKIILDGDDDEEGIPFVKTASYTLENLLNRPYTQISTQTLAEAKGYFTFVDISSIKQSLLVRVHTEAITSTNIPFKISLNGVTLHKYPLYKSSEEGVYDLTFEFTKAAIEAVCGTIVSTNPLKVALINGTFSAGSTLTVYGR